MHHVLVFFMCAHKCTRGSECGVQLMHRNEHLAVKELISLSKLTARFFKNDHY